MGALRELYQMPGRSTYNRAQRNCAVERRELSMALHGEAQKIDVSNVLVIPEEMPLKERVVEQRNTVGPEFVVAIGTEDLQPVNDLRGCSLNCLVRGAAENPYAAVKGVGQVAHP
jgi:hypothetical protein